MTFLTGVLSSRASSEIAVGRRWGDLFRRYRECLGVSQNAFADLVMQDCADASERCPERFALLKIDCPDALSSIDICRFEKGARIPLKRTIHLQLLWVFVMRSAIKSAAEANAMLELADQGWLTRREQQAMFAS